MTAVRQFAWTLTLIDGPRRLDATVSLSGRPDADRETLFRLDVAIQRVNADKGPKDAAVLELTAVYHNLLRRWAEV